MLVQFSVENVLSFKEEQTFQMTSSASYKEHQEHLICGEKPQEPSLLSMSVLYGANASGKSNLVKALGMARDLVIGGPRNPGERIRIEPFMLGSKSAPSSFDFTLILGDYQVQYGFVVTREHVLEEWLYAKELKPSARDIRWFERTSNADGEDDLKWGTRFVDSLGRIDGLGAKQFLNFVGRRTRSNQLLLGELHRSGVAPVADVFSWFKDTLRIISASDMHKSLLSSAKQNDKFRSFMNTVLRGTDTGIDAIAMLEQDVQPEQLRAEGMDIRELLEPLSGGEHMLFLDPIEQDMMMFYRDPQGSLKRGTLCTQRVTSDGQEITFPLTSESDGTRRLMHLIPPLFEMKTGPCVYVIDELDRRMHTNLSRYLIEMFLSHRYKANAYSQMICTTHDTNLIDLGLLRRDEIWFVDKVRHASRLSSLSEYRTRNDLDLRRGYLHGRFGGVPRLDHLLHQDEGVADHDPLSKVRG